MLFELLRADQALPDQDGLALDLYRLPGEPDGGLRFKVYRSGGPMALSAVVPVVGYLLSTQSLPFLKDWWIRTQFKK